jgi:hypothetical protein
MAGVIQKRCLHNEIAVHRRRRFTAKQALRIGNALAEFSYILSLLDMLIGVESSHQALTIGIEFPLPGIHLDRGLRHGLSVTLTTTICVLMALFEATHASALTPTNRFAGQSGMPVATV